MNEVREQTFQYTTTVYTSWHPLRYDKSTGKAARLQSGHLATDLGRRRNKEGGEREDKYHVISR